MATLRAPGVVVSQHHKGFAPQAVGRAVSELTGTLSMTAGDFLTPLLVLKKEPLAHNLAAMQSFCEQHDVSLAPHVKTTMSPEIANAQLDHGAWGMTLATPNQVLTMRMLGAERVILANELVDPTAIDWLSAEMDKHDDFTCYCYIDSETGIEAIEAVLAHRGNTRPFPVLVELGIRGARAGVRDVADAVRLAGRVAESAYLDLAGIGGFEGVIGGTLDAQLLDKVRTYIRDLRKAVDETYASTGGEFIVTAGGSAVFEIVVDELSADWRDGRSIRVVLRSGCYVTHDVGGYAPFRGLIDTQYDAVELRPSLELWARVLSRPEADLALLDFGKRDTGTDSGFPTPQRVLRRGANQIEPAPPAEIVAMNDQHGYLKSSDGTPIAYEVGDLVGCGIAHPCTTFDKWRLIPVVDDDYLMVDTAQTFF